MNLPPLSIPDFPLPFTIPEMMHPAIVHFAVALPVVILLLEIINLMLRRKSIGSISFVLIVLMVLVYLGAYLTGTVDAHDVKNTLIPDTKALFDAHSNGGVWLVYSSVAVLLFKLISAGVNKFPARVVFLVVLGLFFWGATSVVQKGCALTYKHGVNVHKDAAAATVQPVERGTKETVADSVKKAKKAAGEMTKVAKEKAAEVVEKAKEKTEKVVEKVEEKTKEATKKAVETVKEKTSEASKKGEDAVKKAIKPATKTPAAETPAQPVTPVETVPAG